MNDATKKILKAALNHVGKLDKLEQQKLFFDRLEWDEVEYIYKMYLASNFKANKKDCWLLGYFKFLLS